MKSYKHRITLAACRSLWSSYEVDATPKQSARSLKEFLRALYKMSIKGISITNGTISEEIISEFNHLMALMIETDDRFFPQFRS